MASAQDEAFTRLVCQRGLLTPEAVEQARRVQAEAPEALAEPMAHLLVQRRMLAAKDASDVLRELARGRYACTQCGQSLNYNALSALAHLRCPVPGCGGLLALQNHPSTGRFPAANPNRAPQRHPTGVIPGEAWHMKETVIEKAPTTGGRDGAATMRGHAQPAQRAQASSNALTLGEYVVERELGRGSNGVVYLARRQGLERRFALKVLLEDFTRDDEGVKRFQLEAAIASKLQDSGIIGVYDVGKEGDHYYYAMEYCPGRTLQERIEEDGPLDPVEAAELLQKLARTLNKAHEQQVLHRDLKPANIIIDERGRPRVTDFGLARDRSLASSMTQEGDILGTPYYMAPEQLRGKKSLNHRADIYALGVILYECLAGRRPFKARTPMMLADLIVRGDCPPLRQLDPTIPKGLEAVVKKAMAVSPDERYQSGNELAEALEGFLQTERGSWLRRKRRRKPSKRAESDGSAPGPSRLLLGGVALLLVSAVVTIAVVSWQRSVREAQLAEVEATLVKVLRMPSETSPAPTAAMAKELARIEPLARGRPALAAKVSRAQQLTKGWEALERARALPKTPEAWGRNEEALELARLSCGDDPLLGARIQREERRLKSARQLEDALRRSREPVAFREDVVGALESIARDRAEIPDVAARAELGLIRYYLRRGRYRLAETRAQGLGTPEGRLLSVVAEVARRGWGLTSSPRIKEVLERVWGADTEGHVGLTAGALHLMFSRDFAGAAELARRAVQQDPGNVLAGRVQVMSLREVKRNHEAAALAEKLAPRAPDDVGVLVLVATCRLEQGRAERAMVALERAMRISAPRTPIQVYRIQVQALMAQRRFERAVEVGERALEQHPESMSLRVLVGYACHVSKQVGKAQRIYRAAREKDAAQFETTVRKMLIRESEIEAVLRLSRQEAAEREPRRPTPPSSLPPIGSPLSAEAKDTVRRMLARVPQAARAGLEKGLSAAAKGAPWSELRTSFAAALKAAPGSPALRLIAAEVMAKRNVFPEGIKAIAAARESVGADRSALDLLEAQLQLRRGTRKKAWALLDRVQQTATDERLRACARAARLLGEGKAREAFNALRPQLKGGSPHLAALELVPWVMIGVGDWGKAQEAGRALWQKRGALDGGVMTIGASLGLLRLMLTFQKNPVMGFIAAGQRMERIEAQLDATEGGHSRLFVCTFMLARRMPGQRLVNRWVSQRLEEVQKRDPEHAELSLLQGLLGIRSGASADMVLEHWRRARKRDPLVRVADWKAAFEKRFGSSERLDALLRD